MAITCRRSSRRFVGCAESLLLRSSETAYLSIPTTDSRIGSKEAGLAYHSCGYIVYVVLDVVEVNTRPNDTELYVHSR